jgi:hypothetical protein
VNAAQKKNLNSLVALLRRKSWIISVVAVLFFLGTPALWFCLEIQKPLRLERMLFFGSLQEAKSLPEIRQMDLPRDSLSGYDAQFYAQLAFDPTLRNPDLIQAIDNPGYRAKRILMPVFTYVTSFGDPVLRLKIMAWINPVCWLLLIVGLSWVTRLQSWRDFACVAVCACGSGVLFSALRALTDLPSAILSFYGAALAGTGGAFLLSLSILTKETACCTLLAAWKGRFWDWNNLLAATLKVFFILLLPFVWWVYVVWVFGSQNSAGWGNFSFPFISAFRALISGYFSFVETIRWVSFHEMWTPVSIILQAVYLIVNWKRLQEKVFWRMGIGFAVLALVLGPAVWAEASAVCRVVIPLTLSFNLLIREEKLPVFSALLVLGNIGLLAEWAEITLHTY